MLLDFNLTNQTFGTTIRGYYSMSDKTDGQIEAWAKQLKKELA